MAEPCLIVFEGIDGAGTTTQSALYADHLKSLRRRVHVTREPSGGPVGHMLRLVLGGRLTLASARQAEAMALLFAADRLDHVDHEIGPHLRDGSVVLCDRYVLSSIAYQSATARSEDTVAVEAWIRTLNRHAIVPTATVVLDVSPEVAERRRNERSGAVELYEESELQRRLAALYSRAAELLPGEVVHLVDGNAAVDDVAARVRAVLAPHVES
jgi:dTMP kinase